MSNASDLKQSVPDLGLVSRVSVNYGSIVCFVAVVDLLVAVSGSLLASVLYAAARGDILRDGDIIVGMGVMSGLMFLFLASNWGLYRIPALMMPAKLLPKTILAWAISFLMMIAILFLLRESNVVSRGSTLMFAGLVGFVLTVWRVAICNWLRAGIARGDIVGRKAVMIGDETELGEITSPDLLINHGLKEVARVPLPKARGQLISSESVLRCADMAVNISRERNAEELVIAIDWSRADVLEMISQRLRASPLPVRLLPGRAINSIVGRSGAYATRPIVSVDLQRAPLSASERVAKRLLDIVLASIGLVMLAPLLIMTGIAVRLDSKGPAIFRQRRGGFDGRYFMIYKFRTMKVQEDGPTVVQARRNDSRVTRLGRLLRKSSIDELPQLLNVLFGDMSLVGPRPHPLAHDDHYKVLLTEYAFRHHVKPGITGWAQVNGSRGETPHISDMKQRLDLDLYYINNWTFMLDCGIIFKTAFSLISSRAY